MLKKIILTLVLVSGALTLTAQQSYISYTGVGRGVATTFVNDYHALGINPANLGFSENNYEKPITIGTTDLAFSIYSDSLGKDDLRRNLTSVFRDDDEFTQEQRRQAVGEFAGSNFAFNFDFNYFGFSYQHEKIGGFAFGIRERAQWFSNINQNLSELIYLGNTASYFDSLQFVSEQGDTSRIANYESISADSAAMVDKGLTSNPMSYSDFLDGSSIRLSWNREYHLSYGRRFVNIDSVFSLYGGIGVKYIQALAFFNFDASGGTIIANSALTPLLGIDYGPAALQNPTALGEQSGFMPQSVGQGFGLDFGATAILFNKLRIAASVTNIGSITYDGNIYSLNDPDADFEEFEPSGIEEYNNMSSIDQMVSGDGILQLQGEQELQVSLPAIARLGASIQLGKKVHVGAEAVMPFNNEVPGSLNSAVFGLGGDVKVTEWMTLSTGFVTGGNYDYQIPVGINFVFGEGAYEIGFASRDAVTFFTQNSPTISAAMGFARVRF